MQSKRTTLNTLLSSCCFVAAAVMASQSASATVYTVTTGNTTTEATLVSGTGTVEVTGGGTLVLTNSSNTYSGGTLAYGGSILQITNNGQLGAVAGTLTLGDTTTTGTLKFGAATALPSTRLITLAAGGGFIDTGSYASSIAGIISGTGSLTTVAGSGTLTLSGANTYTGATTIVAGSKLTLSGSIATSSKVYNYGTFTLSSNASIISLTGTGSMALGSKTLTLTNAADTFSGVISGTGGFTLSSGTETLSGNNTYTGATTVSGGTLTINGVNTATTGLTSLTGGTLVVGDATHTTAVIGGNVTVNGGTVTGRGTIAGNLTNISTGTVKTGGSIGTLNVGGTYTQASTATLAVEVAPSGASLLNVTGAATITGGTVAVTVDSGTFTEAYYPILKAASVTGGFTAVTGDSASAYVTGIYAVSATEVDLVVAPKAAGQIYGDIITASLEDTTGLNDIAFDHAAFDTCSVPGGTKGSNCHGFSFWTRGIGGVGHTDDGDGASGFNTSTWGVLVGADYSFSDEASLHLTGAHTSGKVTVAGGSGSADTTNWFASVGGHASGPIIALDASAFYASGSADVTRTNALGAVMLSNVKNLVGGFSFQVSAPLFGGDVVPLIKATYGFMTYGSFSETGSANFNLTGTRGKHTTALYDLGVRFSHDFATDGGVVLRPSLYAGVEDDGTISSPGVTVSMASSFGNTFVAPSVIPKRISAVVHAGLDAKLDASWSLQAGFDGRMSGNQQQALFSLGTTFRF